MKYLLSLISLLISTTLLTMDQKITLKDNKKSIIRYGASFAMGYFAAESMNQIKKQGGGIKIAGTLIVCIGCTYLAYKNTP